MPKVNYSTYLVNNCLIYKVIYLVSDSKLNKRDAYDK